MKERVMRLQEEENEARRKRQLLMELEARRRKNEEEQNTLKMQRAAKLEEEQRAIRISVSRRGSEYITPGRTDFCCRARAGGGIAKSCAIF